MAPKYCPNCGFGLFLMSEVKKRQSKTVGLPSGAFGVICGSCTWKGRIVQEGYQGADWQPEEKKVAES